MKNALFLFLAFTAIVQAQTSSVSQNWDILDHKSVVKFELPAEKASGRFAGVEGDLYFDENNLDSSKFDMYLDVNTLSTKDMVMDEVLLSPDYFNSSTYSLVEFHSTKIMKDGAGYKALGTLQIKTTKNAIDLPFTFEKTDFGGLFKAVIQLNASDYNLGEKPKPGKEIYDQVSLSLVIAVAKPK